jgi:hypothetical protein
VATKAPTRTRVCHAVIESAHGLCLDKREMIKVQTPAYERLSKYLKDKDELDVVLREIAELKMALEMLHY